MKSLIDIHVALSTPADMEIWEDKAEEASDRLNDLLFMLYERAEEDTSVEKLEQQIQKVWEIWLEDDHLLDIDMQDLSDWVDHLLATWDDANSYEPE